MEPGLYVVSTPIGNLADVTLRACDILRAVDVIACEDTRVTAKLLRGHSIETPLTPYHDHNAVQARPRLIARLLQGKSVALVCDAGTPLVSDPGYRLIQAAIEVGIAIIPLPGPSAAMAALVVSGLPTDRFMFAGFAPARSAARLRMFAELAQIKATILFFESPKRLPACLLDMARTMGDRPAAVARELTKVYEEVRRGNLLSLAEAYNVEGPPKGEVVIVIGPPLKTQPNIEDVDQHLRSLLGTLSLRDAVDQVAGVTGINRREVYARALVFNESRSVPPGEKTD